MQETNFAAFIESRATEPQDFVCFLDAESGQPITYYQLRLRAVWLAREMQAQGVERGGWVALDMGNCPAFFYALVAGAYGGFSCVLLNTHLTEAEKQERIAEVKDAQRLASLPTLDEVTAMALIAGAERADAVERNAVSAWAHRGVGGFDGQSSAVCLFTSGTSGRPKAALLSWDNLTGAAKAANARLATQGEGVWQLALPAYHVGGLQVFFRSVLNRNAFVLYRSFNAARVLVDARTYAATHISVVDKMLLDMVAAEEEGLPDAAAHLADYECVLLGGAQPNPVTLIRALGLQAKVFASYGSTETSALAVCCRVTDPDHLVLEPLDGYEVQVLNPDASGLGQVAVRGPGVFAGYLNAQTAFTADGFFLTGDSGKMDGGRLQVAERTSDMFVSGGENVYPAQIRDKIFTIEGVTDAYVFGAPDATWGRRPIAFVEAAEVASRFGFNSFYFADDMRNRLATRLSSLYMPDQFVVMQQFPRSGVGKVARSTLERAYEQRLQVAKVEVWKVKLPLVAPIRTAKARLRERESGIVRVTDWAGRTGIGECVAFSTNWYTDETLDEDLAFIRNALAPLLVGRVVLRPEHVPELFENAPGAAERPLACAALENALWDLYGKVRQRSICHLIGAREAATEEGALHEVPAGCVAGGVVVGIDTPEATLAAVQEAHDAGYGRVKLKIRPGHCLEVVQAVREKFPGLQLMLDANQSYRETQVDELHALDALDIACIEEPLDPAAVPTVGPQDLFARLARLQTQLRMRVCLDESWSNAQELYEALEAHPELRCVAVKISKFGGVAKALDFHAWARQRGIEAWPGGMYDTGISKRLHAAFGMLPGVNFAGDISSSARYFTVDVCDPPFVLEGGVLRVNGEEHPYGLGCSLDQGALSRVVLNYWSI